MSRMSPSRNIVLASILMIITAIAVNANWGWGFGFDLWNDQPVSDSQTANDIEISDLSAFELPQANDIGDGPEAVLVIKTWDGGGGANTNWSEPLNWSGDTVPLTTDSVVFDGTSSNNVTVDVNVTVVGWSMNAGYTGTISQGASSITVNGIFVQHSGVFTGGSGPISVTSTFTVDSGQTFTATSGTLTLSAGMTTTGATFSANLGTVQFIGAAATLTGAPTLNNLTINKNSGAVLNFNTTTLTVAGTLTLTEGLVNGTGTIDAQGPVTMASTYDGGTTTVQISGASVRTVTLPVGAVIPKLTVNAPNLTLNTSGVGTITFAQAINIQSCGSFTNGAVNFFFSVAFTNSAAANFTPGGGNLTFNNTYTQTDGTFTPGAGSLDFNSTFTLNGGTFNSFAGDRSFATFTLNGGTFNAPSGTLTLTTGVTIAAAAVFNSGSTLAFTGVASNFSGPASLTLTNLVINKNPGVALTFQSTTTLTVTGTVTLTDGIVQNSGGTGTIDAQGPVAIASTYDGGTTNVQISGAAVRTVTLPVGAAIPRLTINAPNVNVNASGAGTITFAQIITIQSCAGFANGAVNFIFSQAFTLLAAANFTPGGGNLSFNGTFTQTDGTFTPGAGVLSFGSTFTLNGGTFNSPSGTLTLPAGVTIASGAVFNPNGGTVAFTGGSATLSIPAGALALNNLVINKNPGLSLTFNTNTLTVTGTLTLTDGLISGSGTIDAQDAVSMASTFDGGTALVLISGAAARTVTLPAGATAPKMTVNAANVTLNTTGSGTVTFAQVLAIQSCASFTNGLVNFIFGQAFTFSAAANFTPGSGALTFNGSFTQSDGTFTPGGAITFNSSFTLNGGTFTSPSGDMSFPTFTLSGGTFNAPSGTITFTSVVTIAPTGATFNQGTAIAFTGSSANFSGPTAMTLNNLVISKTSSNALRLVSATTLTVTGTMTLTDGRVDDFSGPGTLDAQGPVIMASTYDGGTSQIRFSGNANQTYSNSGGVNGTGIWTVDKTGGTVTLLTDMNLSNGGSNNLTLTNGTITTGGSTVITGTRTVARTNGYIIGNLQRSYTAVSSRLFDVGTSAGYSPATVNATAGTFPATFKVGGNDGTLAGADPLQSLTRNWTLTSGGVSTANITFQYLQGDVPGGADESTFTFLRRSGGTTTSQGVTTLDTSANIATLNGVTAFSDWSLGSVAPPATPTNTPTDTPTSTPTGTPTNTPTETPTPSETPSISGSITYGNAIGNPVPPRFVKNVSVASTAGSPAVGPVITGTPGTYALTGFGAGSYTIKPAKAGGATTAITSNDAARVAQGVSGSLPFVSQNQRFAADVTGNGNISSQDAAKIAQFVAGLPFSPPNITGQWKFFVTGAPSPLPTPPQIYDDGRTYASVTTSLTGEDFVGILVGEVSGNWNPATHPRTEGKGERRKAKGESEDGSFAQNLITVTTQAVVTAAEKEIVIPVNVEGVTGKEVISYEFDLRYDPTVIQPLDKPVDVVGTVSRGLSVVVNSHEPGLLRVVVYGAMPIDDDGVLLNLRFVRVGASNSFSLLVWERFMFNEGEANVSLVDGQVVLLDSTTGH